MPPDPPEAEDGPGEKEEEAPSSPSEEEEGPAVKEQ